MARPKITPTKAPADAPPPKAATITQKQAGIRPRHSTPGMEIRPRAISRQHSSNMPPAFRRSSSRSSRMGAEVRAI